MDRIRKIIQIGSYDESSNEWSNNEGQAYVFFEDESKVPVILEGNDLYQAYESLAREQGIDVDNDIDALGRVIDESIASGKIDLCNRQNVEELNAANEEFELTRARAIELGGQEIPPNIPEIDEPEENYSEELEESVVGKRRLGKTVIASVLTAGAVIGAGFGLAAAIDNKGKTENTKDIDEDADLDNEQETDLTIGEFDKLISTMSYEDTRKVASENAMDLVENFHEATHKEGNFRLEEDGETYLDLSFEEALVLTTFANYSEPEQLYEILGNYNLTSTQAQDILESARSKMITYYMNAVEPSGLAEIFKSEQDRAFFQSFESEVIAFNAMHSRETSDQVIRDVYYNYILDGATNSTDVGSMAKLLAFDAVYGGLSLTESASVEHTQYLEFEGMGAEAETRYYIENVLRLNYDDLSKEEIANYRENIIESGTQLVNLLSTGETKTEDNTTEEELSENVSITNLVDKMGLCNAVNSEITEKMQALDSLEANFEANKGLQITTINNSISTALREAGEDELANKVDASITSVLSDELLTQIRAAGSEAAETVENYENKMATVNGANRPTMAQIIEAANIQTATLENYAGHSKDIATLINNRRHISKQNSYEADENGYIGKDESGIPIYDSSVLDDKTDAEIDEFIKENGTVIDESTSEKKEEVEYDDLTPAEKEEVDEQKAIIEAGLAKDNAQAKGGRDANSYANSSIYSFSKGTVTNPANGEVYDLNSMTFANGVAYSQAFGGSVPSTSSEQIQNAAEVAAENYLNQFSAEEQEAIANGMGTSWESARATLKQSYKSGYISQMQNEINTAISVGNEMKKATEEALKEVENLNKEESDKEDNKATEEKETGKEEDKTTEEKETQTEEKKDSESETKSEGEEKVEEESQKDTPNTTPDTPAPAPAPEEDEYDPNIGEQFQEGEILIEDANGNAVSANEETASVAAAPVTVEAPVANEPVIVEEEKVVVDTAPTTTEIDIEAAVEQAYQEALAAEANNVEEPVKTR